MHNKVFISANELLEDSFELGQQVLDSGFQPDLIIGLWRGGAPIAIAIHELFDHAGITADHIPIRTQLYTGINQPTAKVTINGLDYITERREQCNRILIVDDVFDSGQTMTALTDELTALFAHTPAEIRIATVWYKPTRNISPLSPDYFVRSSEAWLVFPHELCGIDKTELLAHKPGIKHIARHL